MKSRGMGWIGFLGALLMANAAGADNAHLMQLIEILHKKGTLTQEEYQLLRNAATTPPAESAQATPPAAVAPPAATASKAAEPAVTVSSEGGLKVKSQDGASEFTVGGRVQVDGGFYRDDRADHANGTELRRARLDVGGKIEKDWKFKLAFDYADNAVEDKAAYIAYGGWKAATLKAGLFTPPFTLSEAGSSLFGIFMEEAMLVNAFKPDDRIGIGLESSGDHWSAQMAIFGEGGASNDVDDEGSGASARLTWAPIAEKGRLLHLGGTVIYQTPDSAAEAGTDRNGNRVTTDNVTVARFRARPEAHVGTVRMVDTRTLYNVDSWTSYGLESAAVWGPFSVEGEYVVTQLARDLRQPDLRFGGYYGSVSWFPTGESRNYEVKSGGFDRVKPLENFNLKTGGTGAWELAARYSHLDLADKNVDGGEESNVTFGINWYLNPHLRMMANYVLADAFRGGRHDEPNLLESRVQVDF
ncbi:MAG: hypothetical protein HQL88_10840 [Magnetococcales bacterium]|nr:hypothetical protein [Magnetococcales bacterium]